MKFSKLMRRGLAFVLLLAMLVSLVPSVFAAEEDVNGTDFSNLKFEVPDELKNEDVVVARFGENGEIIYEEASEEVRAATGTATRADVTDLLTNRAGTDFSKGQRLAFFVDPSNSEGNSGYTTYSLTATIVKNLVAAGVTDLFVMTKNRAGTFSLTDLKTANTNKGSAKVYAWMHSARDDAYLRSNKNSAQYHFRAGFNNSQNGGDDSVAGWVNLGYAAYITYMEGLVAQATSYADGLLLDSVRFGTEYTGWGQEAKDYMGKTNYNNAVKAMCASAYDQYTSTYRYKADANGFYAYVTSGGSTNTSGKSLENIITKKDDSGNAYTPTTAETDAINSFANYRKGVISNFIGKMKTKFGTSKIIAVALERDWENTNYYKYIKGQDPYNFRNHVKKGFCVTMQVVDYHTTAPVNMAKQVAKYTNVMIGIDIYKAGTVGNYGYTVPDTITDLAESIYSSRYSVNGNYQTYRGCILGAACYTAGHAGAIKVVLSSSGSSPTMTATLANTNMQVYRMLSFLNTHGDTDCDTSVADGGVNQGSGSMKYYANVNSTGNYIGNDADYPGASIGKFGKATLEVPLKNYTVDWDKLPFVRFGFYAKNSLSTYLDCVGIFPIYMVKGHESCSSFNTKVLVTPKCTTVGYTLYTCKTCGYDYVVEVAKTGHTETSAVTKAATCEADGVRTYTCSVCAATRTEAIAKLGHSYNSVVTAPTCTTDGYTTHTCSTCNKTYNDSTVTAPGHKYVNTTVNATCTEGGYTTHVCSVCNHSYTDGVVDALGHNHVATVIEPTCTEGGYTTYTCSGCGDTYTENIINALGHDYRGTVALDPTCTEEGIIIYTCSNCNNSYRDTLPVGGHTYGSDTVEATCTDDGYTIYTCFDCGYSYEGDVVKALGHDYDIVVKEPTCLEGGFSTYTCKNCGDTYDSDYTDALGHIYQEEVTEATCTTDGYTTYTCVCGDSYISDEVEALGHSYTYTDNGSNHIVTCRNCNETTEEDHELENYVCILCNALLCTHENTSIMVDIPNTCTSEGSQRTVCDSCGSTLSTETIPASGHAPVKVSEKAATCTENGNRSYWTCANCGGFYTDASFAFALPPTYPIIVATGHRYTSEEIIPDCTTDGCTKYTCSVCGDSYTTNETPAFGHSYVSEVTAPTCTNAGFTTYTCVACDDTYTADEVKALGHAYEATITVPTCVDAGFTTYACSVCGDTYTDDEIEATGHSYTYTDNGEKHTVSCANCDYSELADHTFVDGSCICGAVEKTEPEMEYVSTLESTMSIGVGAEMQVFYTVLNSRVKNYASFYVEVVKDVAGGEPVTTIFSIENGNLEAFTNNAGAITRYMATYTGIAAKEMGDSFTATLYAVDATGKVYYGPSETSSIKEYLTSQIENADSAELKTLAVDMLHYGAAAQINFGYDAQNLVNADLSEEQLALGTQIAPSASNGFNQSASGCRVNTSVSIGSKVELYLTFIYKPTAESKMELRIKNAKGDIIDTLTPAYTVGANYRAVYDNVGAKQMRELITIELYDNGTLVSKSTTWSIETYVAQTIENSASSVELVNVCKAMLTYGDAAAAYLAASGQ